MIDEDVALTDDEQKDVVGRLKEVICPFMLQRTADSVFRSMTEQKIIWLPLSPWQKAVYDAVREKDVERWAGMLGNSGLNNMYPKFILCTELVKSECIADKRDGISVRPLEPFTRLMFSLQIILGSRKA